MDFLSFYFNFKATFCKNKMLIALEKGNTWVRWLNKDRDFGAKKKVCVGKSFLKKVRENLKKVVGKIEKIQSIINKGNFSYKISFFLYVSFSYI